MISRAFRVALMISVEMWNLAKDNNHLAPLWIPPECKKAVQPLLHVCVEGDE